MKTQINYFAFSGVHSYLSKLILVTVLGFYASANAYAEDNQGTEASAITVAMVTLNDSSKNTGEDRDVYFEEKSLTYVSKYICE